MPGPWRLHHTLVAKGDYRLFQSQPRCQAPGDTPWKPVSTPITYVSISTEMPGPWRLTALLPEHRFFQGFNLNRDARPLATNMISQQFGFFLVVSISTEMPGPWRQLIHTPGSQASPVSISTEMPGPWRRRAHTRRAHLHTSFNLNRDARPLATPFFH